MPGRYIAVGLYSGVAVKRGSTVLQYNSDSTSCMLLVYNYV